MAVLLALKSTKCILVFDSFENTSSKKSSLKTCSLKSFQVDIHTQVDFELNRPKLMLFGTYNQVDESDCA